MKRRFRRAIITIFIDLLIEYRLSSANDRTKLRPLFRIRIDRIGTPIISLMCLKEVGMAIIAAEGLSVYYVKKCLVVKLICFDFLQKRRKHL